MNTYEVPNRHLQTCGFLESVVVKKTSELFSCERRNLECAGLASLRFWVTTLLIDLGFTSSVKGLAACLRSAAWLGARIGETYVLYLHQTPDS